MPPEGSQLLDVRPVDDHLAGHRPGAINVPVGGTSFSTKAGFALDADLPVTVLAADDAEAARAIAAYARSRSARSPATCSAAGPEHSPFVRLDELDELVAAGATVIDVREKDERDEGYIPGSRNVPYRLMRHCCPGPARRPPGRDDLRLGPAGGDRGQHPARARGSTLGRSSAGAWTTGSPAARRQSASGAAAAERRHHPVSG